MLRSQLLALEIPLGNPFPVDGDTRRYDPISAISAGTGLVGGVASIFGASAQAKAAKQAAALQSAAAAKAGQGVMDTASEHNKDIISSADRASGAASDAAGAAAKGVYDRTDAANNKLEQANLLIDPYRATGEKANAVLDKGFGEGGQFNRTPTAADVQMDPGFANRLAFADKGMERSAAARGGAASGTALMDLARFNQNEASSEYSKAFDRFRQNRSDNFGFANTAAGRGLDAGQAEGANLNREGQNLIGAGQYGGDKMYGAATYGGDKVFSAANATADNANTAARANGEYITGGANAQAAGVVGSANAWNQGISGAIGAAGTGAAMYNLLKNPTPAGIVRSPVSGSTRF